MFVFLDQESEVSNIPEKGNLAGEHSQVSLKLSKMFVIFKVERKTRGFSEEQERSKLHRLIQHHRIRLQEEEAEEAEEKEAEQAEEKEEEEEEAEEEAEEVDIGKGFVRLFLTDRHRVV